MCPQRFWIPLVPLHIQPRGGDDLLEPRWGPRLELPASGWRPLSFGAMRGIDGLRYQPLLGCLAVLLAAIGIWIVLVRSDEPVRAAGCQPPANESKLLDTYEADPVFDVRPPDARRIRGPERSEACIQLSFEDVSTTSVSADYRPSRVYTSADLNEAYRNIAVAGGWTPSTELTQPPQAPGPGAGEVRLRFCKRIHAVTSYLDIHAQSVAQQATSDEYRGLHVSITAWPAEPDCRSS